MINEIDLVIKSITIFFLGATSQMAFKNRHWGAMIVTFGLWFTVLRTLILRMTTIDIGVFLYLDPQIIKLVQTNLMGGPIVLFTDIVALITTFFAFVMYSGKDKIFK